MPNSPGDAAGRGGRTGGQRRTRPPPTPPKGGSGRANPGSKGAAPLYLQTMHSAGDAGRERREDGPEHPPPPAGSPPPGAPAFGAPPQARGTRTPGVGPVPIPPPTGAGQELPGESQAGRGRRSPRLPKVRRPAPRARSPWSRRPARVPRRSGAAGLRRERPLFSPPPRPACARPSVPPGEPPDAGR